MSIDQGLASAFGIDVEDPRVSLAVRQISNDEEFLSQLVDERKRKFPDLADFSHQTGIDLPTLGRFEHDPIDFTLDFIRLYALGVEAEITHTVHTSAAKRQDFVETVVKWAFRSEGADGRGTRIVSVTEWQKERSSRDLTNLGGRNG